MSEDQVPPSPPESPPPPPPSPPENAPPPPPPQSTGGDPTNRNVMIVLAYLGPLALVPFFLEKDDREVQWHAKHGLVLLGAEVIVSIIMIIILNIPFLGCLFVPVIFVYFLAVIVLHVMCIVKGINGERLTLPVLSEFADRF